MSHFRHFSRQMSKISTAKTLVSELEPNYRRNVMRLRILFILVVAMVLSACSNEPACSVEGGNMAAPSAGCLVVDQGEVLLVKIMGGTYGPPGGSVDRRESAQCAAERETYEETGVVAHAGELAKRFDNGFHLYWCESVSGREIDITRPIEIKDANWFSSEEFLQLRWRYPNQGATIYSLMQGSSS